METFHKHKQTHTNKRKVKGKKLVTEKMSTFCLNEHLNLNYIWNKPLINSVTYKIKLDK